MPTRIEMGQSLDLSLMMIDAGRRNRPGTSMRPTSITIHNTDNNNRGADASAHGRFVTRTGHYVLPSGRTVWVSWHYSVDDSEVIKHLPIHEVAYHAKDGNRSSIGIEICMNSDNDQAMADDRAARLVAVLLHDLGLDVSEVRTHKSWTGKNCPSLLLGSSSGMSWDAFIERVRDHLGSITPDAIPLSPTADPLAADLEGLAESAPFSLDGVSDEVREDIDNEIDHAALEAAMSEAGD